MAKTTYKVGDKVKYVSGPENYYTIGNVYEVLTVEEDSYRITDNEGNRHNWTSVAYGRFELISQKPTKNQRITALEQKVEAMQAEIDALKAAQKVTASAPKILVKSEADIAKVAEEIATRLKVRAKLTPNEQRKAIIDEAKAFVEAKKNDVTGPVKLGLNLPAEGKRVSISDVYSFVSEGTRKVCDAEFHINAERRTVTVLMKGAIPKRLYGKAIAKCAPGDVFNADIGKAIALGRALGLDVSKFEKAVQPSEVVAGMDVIHTNDKDVYKIEGIYEGNRYDMRHTDGEYFGKFRMTDSIENFYDILNDSEAQY